MKTAPDNYQSHVEVNKCTETKEPRVPDDHPGDAFAIDDLAMVPWDMYGARAASSRMSSSTLAMPKIKTANGKAIGGSGESLYANAQRCLLDFWDKHLVFPGLSNLDAVFNTTSTKKGFDRDHLMQRTLGRGAIISGILDACEDEGIFASNRISSILASPSLIFEDYARDGRLANALRRNPKGTLQPLMNWLDANVND
jgi:hypothetical protein